MSTFRAGAAALLLSAAAAHAQQADPEPVTIDAFSIWSASGSLIRTGADAHSFAGEMRGPFFVDAGQGPIPSGEIACVGALTSEEASGRQVGAARCLLTADDGAVAFGEFECSGFRVIGCAGMFRLTGGEGRLAGVTGAGSIVIRRYATSLTVSDGGVVAERALGVASWKGFTLNAAPAAAQ